VLLNVQNLDLAYGPKVLFRDAALRIQPRDRVGLVGPNGSGKSTLLKIILGHTDFDRREMEKGTDVVFGYLPQEGIVLQDRPLIEEVEEAASDIRIVEGHLKATEAELARLEHDAPEYAECVERLSHYTERLRDLEAHKLRSRAEAILFGLGFRNNDLQRHCGEFSGGWQMRIALARLLLEEPDLLMLDEPTNHLDLDSLRWLEQFLKNYPGAVLLISHDRTFLDQLTTAIVSIEASELIRYTGNYTRFLEQREARQAQLESARKNQDRKIAQTERFIERFRYKASKATQVQSRIKQLERIERIGEESAEKTIHFTFPLSRKSGHTVAQLEAIDKSYGPQTVFSGFSLTVEAGDRIGVVGLNGAGKSTLARILAQRESIDGGERELGYKVDLGYFAQDQSDEMNPEVTVYAAAEEGIHAKETHIRSILGAFLFSENDLEKPVKVLSGGEKNRLALARLLLRPSNFLILDEPTNHLDMASKAVLQEALNAFPGTTFVVSHDRHFLNPVVNKILEIQPGSCRVFPGNLDDYLWKIDQERSPEGTRGNTGPASSDPENPRERRRRQAQRVQRRAPLKRKLDQLESDIARLEADIAKREAEMTDKAFFQQGSQTTERIREYDKWKSLLESKLGEWTSAGDELAELEQEPLS
jgi:ATP-binding cassette subfamily F protein 3